MSYVKLREEVRHTMLHLRTVSEVNSPLEPLLPCRLLALPDEVKLEIVKHIDRRRDLYNFSLACRSLEDVTLSRLYRTIDVDVPRTENFTFKQGCLPTFRPYVLRNMKELAIRNGVMDKNDHIYHKRRRSDAGSMDSYVSEIMGGVPQDQLSSFSFLHQAPMSLSVLDGLSKRHGRSLLHLRCYELDLVKAVGTSIPSNLHTFECRSVLTGERVIKFVQANEKTLTSLTLGQDRHLIEQYRQSRISFLNQIPRPRDFLGSSVELNAICNLRSLSLSGLDLSPIIPQNFEAALFLTQLESITLESCPETGMFLDMLCETFTYVQAHQRVAFAHPIQLKKFSFRHELFTHPLQTSLVRFLNSFSGLTSLSLLVENTTFASRPSTFLFTHGQTLETLVLEARIQPRESLSIDTSRPIGSGGSQQQLWQETIGDICTLCPNLIELGMAFPWDDEIMRLHKQKLSSLEHLKTIHIRNFPSSQTLSQLGDYAIREYAIKFLEWCFPASSTSSDSTTGGASRNSHPPQLETLAIGPTLYSTRWRTGVPVSSAERIVSRSVPVHPSLLLGLGSAMPQQLHTQFSLSSPALKKQYSHPPEHLRTHYFCLDWARTRFGRWSPMISSVGEKYMEEVRGQKQLGGVFEGAWLR